MSGPVLDNASQDQRAPTKLALGGLIVPVFFAAMFATYIIGA